MSGPNARPTHTKRNVVSLVALVFGALAVTAGLWFIGAYVFGAVVGRLGEPDQSLLFWYLPLVFIGFASLTVGVGAIVFGIASRRRAGTEAVADRAHGAGADV